MSDESDKIGRIEKTDKQRLDLKAGPRFVYSSNLDFCQVPILICGQDRQTVIKKLYFRVYFSARKNCLKPAKFFPM